MCRWDGGGVRVVTVIWWGCEGDCVIPCPAVTSDAAGDGADDEQPTDDGGGEVWLSSETI